MNFCRKTVRRARARRRSSYARADGDFELSPPNESAAPHPRFSRRDPAFERLFRSYRWDATRLGPLETWPKRLRGYVEMILDLPSPAIIFWGEDHVQLYNAGYATIMGPRHPKYLGATYLECWPDTYPTIHPWMERVLRGEVLEVVDAPFTLTRHGFDEETYFTFSFSPLEDDAGAIGGFLQIVVETTPEVLARRRAATLQSLAPGAAGGADMAAVLAANSADVPFAHLYLRDEATGRLVLSAATGGDAPAQIPSAALRAYETQTPQPVTAGAGRNALALPVRRTAGDPPRGAIVLGRSTRLPFDDAYFAFFTGVAREIAVNLSAAQEKTAHELAERERQSLYDFFMLAPAPLVILDGPEHRYLLANPRYLELVGREVVGRTIAEVFPGGEAREFVAILDRVYRTGEPYVGRDLPLQLEGRQEMRINVSYVPLRRADGTVRGILAFQYDITPEVDARRQSEDLARELQQAVRARDEFLGIASHELKTPLTALRLQIQMAERKFAAVDPARLMKQANRLVRLVDDMLDIARINAGKLLLERARIDLSGIVAEVLERFEPQLSAAGTRVDRQLQPGLVGSWDAYRLEQVVTNLITNALKYAPGAPIEVRTSRNDGVAVLTLEDRGPGIAPADTERIFGRFERAANPNQISGLGLGLYISRQIVDAHGGSIRAQPRPGGGAAFTIELPLG